MSDTPALRLMAILGNFHLVPLIHVAAKLELADRLQHGDKSIEQLARETNCRLPQLTRLVRALAGIEVLTVRADSMVALGPLGQALVSTARDSVHAMARAIGEPFYWTPWAFLHAAVMEGRSAFEHAHGTPFFDYCATQPDAAALFDAWMTQSSRLQAHGLVESLDLAGSVRVVDIGGGQGELLSAILRRHWMLSGTLFDAPGVIDTARTHVPASVAPRIRFEAGNFFEAVPQGADTYILKHVLHDWDDDRAVTILENCRRALGEDGRILIIEMVVPETGSAHVSVAMDIAMMVFQDGGRERTEAEFRALCARAGLRLTRVTPTGLPQAILEAVI